MKSLFALTLTLSAAAGSKYYIGNYTANGAVTGLVPYPLDTCVPNGAGSGCKFVVFSCSDGMITQKTYKSSDSFCSTTDTSSTCTGTFTTTSWAVKNVAGKEGYASCSGDQSYMQLAQYISSCKTWNSGGNPLAATIVSMDACTYQKTVDDVDIYSKTQCSGDGFVSTTYAGDNTCSGTAATTNMVDNNCNFYGVQLGLNIYTAKIKCVVGGVNQRCTTPLSTFDGEVEFFNLTTVPDFQQFYTSLFPFATVEVTGQSSSSIKLDLEFCSAWEDQKYADQVEDLGTTTYNKLSDSEASVCWNCKDATCTNTSICSTAYCSSTLQCVPTTTTAEPVSSSSILSISILSLVILLLSLLFE